MSNETSTGLRGMFIKLVKLLGPVTKNKLSEFINSTFQRGETQYPRKLSRMNLIYKRRGNHNIINSYRQITVISLLYRTRMRVLKSRWEKLVEGKAILGELQNHFRSEKRLEDNLFVLTQCVQVAKREQRPLWLAYLDTESVYDNAKQENYGTHCSRWDYAKKQQPS